jgi:hypothetical protein
MQHWGPAMKRDYHTRHSGMTRWDACLTAAFFVALAVLLVAAFGPVLAHYAMTVLHTIRGR